MPAIGPAIRSNSMPEFFGCGSRILFIQAYISDDLPTKKPKICQVPFYRLLRKAAFQEKLGKRPHCLKQMLPVIQVLFGSHPAFRPFREIRAYFSQFTHDPFLFLAGSRGLGKIEKPGNIFSCVKFLV